MCHRVYASREFGRPSAAGTSERDELPDGCLGGPSLEAHDEADIEGLGEALKSRDARAVLARLDSRDRGMARPHSIGELLLGEPELGPAHDHEPRDALVRGQAVLCGPVREVSAPPAPGGV